ncbi:hypothetical protein CBER1_00334 [Cercospora berteroae]|uniref:Nucleolar 27S pre-rRNA processing Urb2/Npa2 C-terminal domain-containing protein n=1 Tax=Cercospora berteroae TaxID=357750 RepID=A0A2S6C1K4_9PEZI|nr:hypothetical protein CBER1_00334 [Cercospora berteroae]
MEKPTSLDRLKALDKLPTLPLQLEEAQQLCNHPSRAEMILRWLVNKLKSSQEARTDAGSWDSLTLCLRLLPTQKIASVLDPGSFQEILQLTCAERGLPERTLQAVAATWGLLSQQSQALSGAAIKALLKTDGAAAARVSGYWYQHVYAILQMEDSATRTGTAISLLKVGLQLWELRRRSQSDDATFSEHCLLPACQLVVLLRKNIPAGAKRKRAQEAFESSANPSRSLESIIAQHSVLPARSVFTSTRQKQDGHKKRTAFGKNEQSLDQVLEPFSGSSVNCYEIAPVLMDIALSAVSTPTPGLRSREAPWIETLFDALLNLLDSDSRDQRSATIAEMLRYIRLRKMPLSTQKLANLAASVLADASGHKNSGRTLVAEIIAFNAGALTEASIARKLFKAIVSWQASNSTADTVIIRDRIVNPVIEAFAQKQQMSELLELWHQQLIESKDHESSGIWHVIVPQMSEVLASPTANAVAMSALARYSTLLQQVVDAQENLDGDNVASRLRSDLVLLRAVLQGLRNNSHLVEVQKELDATRARLMTLVKTNMKQIPASCLNEVWQLFTLVLELWSPSYIAAQHGQSAVKDVLETLVANDLFETAVEDCQSTLTSSLAAQVLVGTICTLAQPYDMSKQCTKALKRAVEALCERPSTMVNFPQLITGLSSKQIGTVLQTALAAQNEDTQRLFSQLSASLPHSENFSAILAELPVHLLVAFSPSSLAPAQRTKVVTRLLDEAHDSDNEDSPASRLALIVELLAYPVDGFSVTTATSKLCDYVRRSLVANVLGDSETFARALALVQPSMRATFQSMSTKTSRDYQELSAVAGETIDVLEKASTETEPVSSPAMLAVSVLIALIEEAADDASAYAHRNKRLVNTLMGVLVTSLENVTSTLDRDLNSELFTATAEGLLNFPESVLSLSGSKSRKFASKIVASAEGVLQAESRCPHHVLVASFRLLCKYDPASETLTRASSILSRDLNARSSGAILRIYEEALETKFGPDEISTIIASGPPQTYAIAQLHLCAVRKLRGQMLESTENLSTNDVWHYLLRTLLEAQDFCIRGEVLQTIAVLLEAKGFVLNQYSLEQTLQSLHSLLTTGSHIESFFPKVCKILKVLINQYRTKLQGRFHLVTLVFQALLSGLLNDTSSASARLQDYHGRLVAKLLELFCKPIWVRSTATNLVDASREAQKYAGQFVQHILHHYCALVLSSTPAEGIRLAVRPGIFAVIEAMEAYDEAGVRSLSAAMNSNERAILRMVVQDWRQFGKWEGS